MFRVLDSAGEDAEVGKTQGYWLCEADFVSTLRIGAKSLGAIGFPRDWPAVYSSSKILKSLIGKKGQVAGKKVSVVGSPSAEDLQEIRGVAVYPLQSFANAEKIERASGMRVVRGWAIFEHLDKDVSAAFCAVRYWWNETADARWLDFTPRPACWQDLLFCEAAGDASKVRTKLNVEELDIVLHLLEHVYGFALAPASAPAAVEVKRGAPSSAPVPPKPKKEASARGIEAKPKAVASIGTSTSSGVVVAPAEKPKARAAASKPLEGVAASLAARVLNGEVEAVRELESAAKGDEDLCVRIAKQDEVVGALVSMLPEEAECEPALKLLLLLSDAGVGQKDAEVQDAAVAAGVVPPLVRVIAGGESHLQELAAAILGNLCHESPTNQDKIAKVSVFRPLVDLLDADVGPAQEAAYAIWNLAVGHDKNSEKFVKLGAVPKLAELLKSSSDIAQENAAGALMHVTMSEEAKAAIVKAEAIPRLCELLSPGYEPEVSSQAAGALLNLASDCSENAKVIVRHGAITPLLALVKEGGDLARDYAAGALMNLIRGDMDVADKAAKDGAIPVLAGLLAKPSGQSEALGALANLASGSAERQIAIYKAQVTRKSVNLLGDRDVDIRRSAAALIMNLAPHVKIKERIVEAGALKPLAALLSDDDDAVKERAAGALANLFNDHSGNVHAGFEQAPDMIPSLIAILNGVWLTEDARRQAAHALAMLAAEDGPCDAVWTAGAGPPLLALLKDSVAEAALGIMNLAWRWPEVKQELAAGGALESLAKMLRSGDAMAREYAAGALMNMTAGSKENAVKVESCVTPLVRLLKAPGVQAAEWAAGALANVVRAGPAAQKTAADAGAAASLVAVLPKATANGKTLVVLAFTSLAETQADVVRKVLGAREKAMLREFRDGGNEELTEYTSTLVESLGGGFAL